MLESAGLKAIQEQPDWEQGPGQSHLPSLHSWFHE